MAIKAEVLDTDFNVVVGGVFHDTGRPGVSVPGLTEDSPLWNPATMGNRRSGVIQPWIVDGSMDLDITRGSRRQMTMTLLNPEAEFTPGSDWGGLFYVNRMIRLYRGIVLDTENETEFAPIGTFMLDSADVVAERNMSLVVLSGSDLWKKLAKAQFGHPTKFGANMHINDVLKYMAETAGVTRYVFDDLDHRGSTPKYIPTTLYYEANAVIGDEMLKLANDFALDIYFDPMGRLVSEDMKFPTDLAVVWEFVPQQDTSLLTVKASYTDEKLYNHIVVTGTADENAPVHAEAEDTDPASPTSTSRIGRRTYNYESKFIATTAQAQATADKFLQEHTTVTEDIELQIICNPALEGNDMIAVRESEFTKLNSQYRIRSFSIPLGSSRETMKLQRPITV